MDRVALAWSGGKDAAYALYQLQSSDDYEVVELFTTFNEEYDRSSMHGVRRPLYDRQSTALDVPLRSVMLPSEPSNEEYNRVMAHELDRYVDRGIEHVAFADLFLEDIRAYREAQLAETEVEGLWPVWGYDTDTLIEEMLDAGFRATVVAVDGDALGPEFAGRELDRSFLADVPESVDPCGEHGEFHTFVRDGPPFEQPVPIEVGETVTRHVGETEIHYADIELAESG